MKEGRNGIRDERAKQLILLKGLRGGEEEKIRDLNLGSSEISLKCSIESYLGESGILLVYRKIEGEVSANEILIGK